MTLVAGVDLGKTTCRVAASRDSKPLGTAEVPGARGLAELRGAEAARAALAAGLAAVRRSAGLAADEAFDVVAVGAAGREAVGAESDLASRLAGGLGVRELVLTTDAITSHAGAFAGGTGAVVAIGTGAVAVGLGPGGLTPVDGLGYWLGDDGGGAWIGRRALRHALAAGAGRGPATLLLAAAEDRYGELARLPGTLAVGDDVAATTAGFAADVVACAERGDELALEVLDAAASALVETVTAAARGSGVDQVTAVGGLASVALLTERWLHRLPDDLTVVPARGSALDGAVLLAERRDLPHEAYVARSRVEADQAVSEDVDALPTEQVRPDLADLDERSPEDLVDLLLAAEATVPAAVAAAKAGIAAAVSLAEKALLAGGRLVYIGAGTPGRLAALDAAECPPTFGTDPSCVVALLAGGGQATTSAVEGAEDDVDAGRADVQAIGVGPDDLVVGIAASGRTPYVLAALEAAHALGAPTVAVVNNAGSPAAGLADVAVELLTGPEVLAGSTRMKAGTAQKVVLNVLSTSAMVRAGKTYGAWMVDVHTTNEKLRLRARRILREAAGVTDQQAAAALDAADGHTRTALVSLLADSDADTSRVALGRAQGRVREAVAALARSRDER